ncbi:uncharacterized protein YvpB [Salirhabdus euzebyi]|uniref:Uncharacterized protein YvpB n=1 Tax=Salirhabdus euzebyi TaxID=394506 RepID=A0A841Q9Q6_9BACI|nr:C39 family peptidase [Salirhabdus euzebyi]MBB6455105.1 uncharacterized protein YvpB [Salirhabdus euzebyi]
MRNRRRRRKLNRKGRMLVFLLIILFFMFNQDKVTSFIREESIILNVPLISQLPELPRGCEVTSLAMMLQYKGIDVNKMELANEIDKVPFLEDGLSGNPNDGFVGSMTTIDQPGLGVYNEPIYELAEKYLPGKIKNLSGKSFDAIYKALNDKQPVWVINNTWFTTVPNEYWETWETATGKIDITYKEHSVVITGYDEEFIYINDPLTHEKNRQIDKQKFIAGWEQMGSHAITFN